MSKKKPPANRQSTVAERTHLIDQHLMLTGKLVQNAAVADELMAQALSVILGVQIETSRAIMFALDSGSARASILTRVAELHLATAGVETVNLLIKAVNKVSKQRQAVAHSPMMFGTPDVHGSPIFELYSPRAGESKPLTANLQNELLKHSTSGLKEAMTARSRLDELLTDSKKPKD